MTTRDDNSPSVGRGKPDTVMQRGADELSSIGQEFKEAVGRLGKLTMKAIPYGGVALEVIQLVQDLNNNEQQRRLHDYILSVAQDAQYNPKLELREQDVIPVIRKLAADDEAAKTEYYTRLTVSLGRTPLSKMPHDLRYHFIRLVSSLTCYQIAFARELKIRKTIPVRNTASFEEAELALTGQDSGMAMQAVRALQNAGLIREKTYLPREKKPEGTLYDATSDFTTLMGLLFYPADFEPETVGLQRKEMSDIIIVGKPCFIDNLYETYLLAALKKAGLNAKFVESNDNHLTTDWAQLYLHTGMEEDSHVQMIRLYLTREGIPPWKSNAENYLSCRFETRTYLRDKSSSTREVEYFCKQMDQVVNSALTIMKNLKPHA